jgi:hypothetical protein
MRKLLLIGLFLVSVWAWGGPIQPIMSIRADYIWDVSGQFALESGQFAGGQIYPPNTFTFDIKVGMIIVDWLWFEAELMTYNSLVADPSLQGMFAPFQVDYGFRGGIQHWGVRVGLDHWCYHPGKIYGYDYPEKYGGVTSVFIEFDVERMRFYK